MKSSIPKQFLHIDGKPAILHSAEVFCNWKRHEGFICVANPDYLHETEDALKNIRMLCGKENKLFNIVPGGSNRHDSTLAGISALRDSVDEDDLLFFHDAARPLITEEELENLFSVFAGDSLIEIASLVSPVTETLVMGNSLPGSMTKSLNRNQVFSVKTPQVLKVSALKRLKDNEGGPEFTDLLTWGESCGIYGTLVNADESNIKLTKSSDLEIMNAIFARRGR